MLILDSAAKQWKNQVIRRVRRTRPAIALIALVFLFAAPFVSSAMWQFSRSPRGSRVPDRADYPQWEIDQNFEHDVFTFARVQFDSYGGGRGGGHWQNDYPDCDWNFSYRLQQLTSLEVDPNGKVLRLTDDELLDYPFIYMSNVQRMMLSEKEVEGLRKYLQNGGFLMADDFWTPAAWRYVRGEMERVFPNAQPRELSLDHPIFHLVYDFKEIPRIPSIRAWERGYAFEYWHGDSEGDEDPHFYGYFDEQERLVALFCLNNDIGDGFEREGQNREYFEEYSVKVSYPLGINIVMYAMSH